MLSILIPIYKYNAFPLVLELVKQALSEKIEFEIICVDDASGSSLNQYNEKINSLNNSTFFSNAKNLGYSSNRNFLVSIAKFNNLLFIDGDSLIINDFFINAYLNMLSKEFDIVYGGRIHPNSISNPYKSLRWKYGKFREDKPANRRIKQKYKTLMFNNTLVNKSVFNLIKFDVITNKYGHDDTLFAYQANLAKLNISHIDNSVMHAGIDENDAFLKKTETALNNLKYISKHNLISSGFVKMLSIHEKLKRFKIDLILTMFYKQFKNKMKLNLISKHPSLKIFNLYRLSYFCYIYNKKT
ncbi:glycosyltransferase family 2 protein [Changchengzhania lutea]|uniref:glycosyltransferase family 2 protein n=1 Tax=Changchengzhania lutea TaxID=2049305 RepID=UPI00115EE973|nr:glycosyltransferase [Changchengzhania lutea]